MLGRTKIGGLAARRRRRLWIGSLTTVALLLMVGTGVSLVVRPWSAEFQHGGLEIADPPEPVRAFPEIAPPAPNAPTPTPAGLTAALTPVVTNPDLGAFTGSVTDPASGTVLWSTGPDTPAIPSSTAKLLTTAAALLTLGPQHQTHTTVVAGKTPGEVVLVGGGDPTLTAHPEGGYYPESPTLFDLAAQVRKADVALETVTVDISAYTGPTMAQGWEAIDIPGGSIAPIEAVMLDGGRLDPLIEYSPRSHTPALDAGRRLATELGLDPQHVAFGEAPPHARELARVSSAPLRERLYTMMVHSDNVLAETIAREIAQETGQDASFAGGVDAVTTVLRQAGFDLAGVTMHDASGLSTADRIPARVLDSILATAARTPPQDSDTEPAVAAQLAPLLDTLPVAGATGSLVNRYVVRDRVGAGWVRAKTGTLSVSSTLVGYVLDTDGRVLTFALMSNDRPPGVSRPALDAIAATLRHCGCT